MWLINKILIKLSGLMRFIYYLFIYYKYVLKMHKCYGFANEYIVFIFFLYIFYCIYNNYYNLNFDI